MENRRHFLKNIGATLAIPAFINETYAHAITQQTAKLTDVSPAIAAQDEDFWAWVKTQYTVSPNIMNLNNGGVCPQPKAVQDAHIRYYQYCNEAPSYYMWRILDQGRETLRTKLADLAGCEPDEIAINRNATEGLNTTIFGLNLKAGDEVVLTKQDYPNMINAWKQREKRDGIKLVWLDLDLPNESDEYFVKKYTSAFTAKTKVVHITHMINWIGQIIPVKKIADIAHKQGIEVIADGAHTFGLLDFKIPDLGCDYFATSLHKWLGAPFGSGLMYIKKEKIKNVWALLSNGEPDGADIRKFESLGTRSFASEMAIGTAADFHLSIGAARKQARMHYLQRYWTDKARQIPGVHIHTSPLPAYACAIALVSVDGLKTSELDAELFNKYKLHTVGIDWENIHGVRVTPNVYTTPKELDILVNALEKISKTAVKKM